MNVNKAILVGNVTRDPEIRTTQSGQTVAAFGLATNRYWTGKDGQKQEQVEFHNVVLWGRLAEIAGQYLTKGQSVYIEGRIQTRTYTAKDGTEKRITEIVGENMQLGSRRQGGYSSSGSQQPAQSAKSFNKDQNQETAKEEIPTINLEDEREEVKISDVPF